jgi:hypothetical protein
MFIYHAVPRLFLSPKVPILKSLDDFYDPIYSMSKARKSENSIKCGNGTSILATTMFFFSNDHLDRISLPRDNETEF